MKSETKLMKCVISAEKNATHTHIRTTTTAAGVVVVVSVDLRVSCGSRGEEKYVSARHAEVQKTLFEKHNENKSNNNAQCTTNNVQCTSTTHTYTHTPKLFIQICILNLRHHRSGNLSASACLAVCGSVCVGAMLYVGQPEGVANMRISHWECRTIVSLQDSSSSCWGIVCLRSVFRDVGGSC